MVIVSTPTVTTLLFNEYYETYGMYHLKVSAFLKGKYFEWFLSN